MCHLCPVGGRKLRGCEEPRKHPYRLDLEERDGKPGYRYEYEYCPVNYVEPHHRTWLGLYNLFKQGKMLESGGVADQPAKYIDVMMFLDRLWNKAEAEKIKEARGGK